MRPFLEAVRPMVSILIAMVLCIVWALASPNQVLQRGDTRIFFYVTGTLCANLSCRLIVAQMSSTRCELINMFIYPLFGAVCSSLLIPGLPKEAEMFMLYLLAVGFTIFHLHYGVCVVLQMASHLRIDAFSIKDQGNVRLLSSHAADNNLTLP
jgi:ethanolaminephosphotransferase